MSFSLTADCTYGWIIKLFHNLGPFLDGHATIKSNKQISATFERSFRSCSLNYKLN